MNYGSERTVSFILQGRNFVYCGEVHNIIYKSLRDILKEEYGLTVG